MKTKTFFFLVSFTILAYTSCSKPSKEDLSQITENETATINDSINGTDGTNETNDTTDTNDTNDINNNGTGGINGIDSTANNSTNIKILFIGSSYFDFNDLPQIFSDITTKINKDIFIDQRILSGTFLNFHASDELTQEKIQEKNWDFVVLQGVGINVAYPSGYQNYPYNYPSHSPYLEQIYTQIKEGNSETVVLFCMPWAFEDGMTWVKGGIDTYEMMQQKIYDNTISIKNNVGISIAPVGMAFNTIMTENHPLHYIFRRDFNHPSYKGSYLMACVLYASIFQESTKNIDFYGNIPINEAVHFQDVANSVVFNNFGLWNIPSIQNN